MQIIQVLDIPSQLVRVTLAGQQCEIRLYWRTTGMFCDVSMGGTTVCAGVQALDRTRIVRAFYTGFVGDLMFYDTQGFSDPTVPGLGTRYVFAYLNQGDY